MKEWANWYANQGWPVFPVFGVDGDGVCLCGSGRGCSDPGKHPMVKYKEEATTSGLTTDLFWDEHPDANLGFHCTKFTVVDLDGDGVNEFKKLRGKYKDLNPPNTPTVKTSRGYHLYFRHVEGIKNCAGLKVSEEEKIRGIDIRTVGGFVVAPPSYHHSGHQYQWVKGRHPIDVPLAEMPGWLRWFLRKDFEDSAQQETKIFKPLEFDVSFWEGRVYPDKSRSNHLTSAAGKLFKMMSGGKIPYSDLTGKVEEALVTINDMCCKPPLNEREVLRIASSVARYG